MRNIKVGCIFLFSLCIASCSGMKIDDFKDNKPEFKLEQYFEGPSKGYGVVYDWRGNVTRQFVVDLMGTWDGKVLVLDEDFLFSDGEKQKRVWSIEKIGENNYQGTAGDVIGIAKGKRSGNALNWGYTLRVPVDETTYDLVFDDWMFLQTEKILLNRAYMKKWGFVVGEVHLFFLKEDTAND